jgi:hypothetical protein
MHEEISGRLRSKKMLIEMDSFHQLIAKTGDSQLIGCRFQNGIATLELELYDVDSTVQINLPTRFIFAEKLDFTHPDDISLICRLEIIELGIFLHTQHGYYMPPADFADVMKQTRRGLSLAYGQKQSEAKWLVNAIGYDRLFSCLLKEINDVRWVEINV